NQRDLADALLVTKGNVTQILDRMEACGLLRRHQVGRAKCVFLTEEGRALWQRVVPEHERVVAAQLDALSPAEQRELARLLGVVARSLRAQAGSAGRGAGGGKTATGSSPSGRSIPKSVQPGRDGSVET